MISMVKRYIIRQMFFPVKRRDWDQWKKKIEDMIKKTKKK
jgi:hypothetical protein